MAEPRIASHHDDPSAPLADRLLLALGMWPSYVEQIGVEPIIEATVMLRSDAHRYPMVCEDYGVQRDEIERLRSLIRSVSECYDGTFEGQGAHVFIPADTWNAVKAEAAPSGRQEAVDDAISARQMRSDMGHHGGTYGPA